MISILRVKNQEATSVSLTIGVLRRFIDSKCGIIFDSVFRTFSAKAATDLAMIDDAIMDEPTDGN